MDDRAKLRPASILLSLLLLSPLLWVPGYGYDGVRRPVALGLVALLLALAALRRDLVPGRRDPVLLAGLALLAAQGLSLLAAVSPAEGRVPIVLLFAGVALYVALRSGLVAREFVREGASLVVSIVGASLGALAIAVPSVSTEGNTNYAGALSGMLLPASLGFALAARGGGVRALHILSAASLLVLLVLTQSRGGWVGAVAGLGVLTAAAGAKRVPRWKGLLVALALVGILPVVLPGSRVRSEAGREGVSFRLEAWKSARQMTSDRPLLGAGAGNFAVVYPLYRTEAEYRVSTAHTDGRFADVEDPHSSWVQAAVETGLAGLAAFAALAGIAARNWARAVRAVADPSTAALLAGLGGGAAAYLVSGLFNTLTLHVSPTILFWAFLGMIALLGRPEQEPSPVGRSSLALPLAGSLAAFLATFWAGAWAYADWAFTKGMATSDPDSRETMMLKSLGGDPQASRAHMELARSRAALGKPAEAAMAGREAVRLRPHSVTALNNLAVWILASKGDEAEAERDLRHAVEVAPYYHLSHFNLGSMLFQRKAWPAAREEFARAVAAESGHGPSVRSLGECLAMEGRSAEAAEQFRRAQALGIDSKRFLRAEYPQWARDPAFAEFFR